jgi:hypothetical protein
MDTQKRNKLIVLGLAGVVAAWSLRSRVDGIVMKPIRDLEAKVRNAEKEGLELQDKMQELRLARGRLREWQDASLPEDPNDASRLYREWLLSLTRQCGFSGQEFDVTVGAKAPRNEFNEISVEVRKAETDIAGLTRFLYLFQQASLLQRVSSMTIDSQGTQGKTRLEVTLTAQALWVPGNDDMSNRLELFPRTTLAEKVDATATTLKVSGGDLTVTEPFEPFLVRVERELVRVDAAGPDVWTVTRGLHGTKAAELAAGSVVELFPVVWDRREVALEKYSAFAEPSPFSVATAPKSWNPRLAGVSSQTVKPGEAVSFTARAESFDPEKGEPQFALENAVDGMTIDPKTGQFSWTPSAELAAGEYTATVILTQPGNDQVRLTAPLSITVKMPNAAPQLTLPETGIVVIGREFKLQATATDDGPKEKLKFSFANKAPEGLTIDASSGELKWTPATSFTPGEYEVTVQVTDAGDGPQSASSRLTLNVQDDSASLTVLTAAIGKDGVMYAWFRNKGTNKTDKLKEGDKLVYSEISGELLEISSRSIKMRDVEGVWKLALGDTIRERKLIEPATPVAPGAASPKQDPGSYDADPPAAQPAPTADAPTTPPTEPAGEPTPQVTPPLEPQPPRG